MFCSDSSQVFEPKIPWTTLVFDEGTRILPMKMMPRELRASHASFEAPGIPTEATHAITTVRGRKTGQRTWDRGGK